MSWPKASNYLVSVGRGCGFAIGQVRDLGTKPGFLFERI